ncbi:Clp protease N-terminal domain-containing protein [Devosia marina]|uniref:Peptidase n=1 Tax=Devosia marina TaxID=2683198 RepID=A0A7X3K3I0_9HYPH|nr:Clp protease N-terminal domain-containing protein [Devosia marina]MVS98644.1 peptidase [Devosia marina]
MFNAIKSKLRDMGTIKQLCERAEKHALHDRQPEPGAEHFLLAALEMEDGTARRAFQAAGMDPDGLKAAIAQQYVAALESIGLAVEPTADHHDAVARPPAPGAYHAAPSGQDVMQALADSRNQHAPLLGAHVVAVVAAMPHGIAARALRGMGSDPVLLRTMAEEVAASYSPAT